MTYWRLRYHLIWATFERQPALTVECERAFYGVLYRKAEELSLKIHAAGNVEDHVHVVLSIPPKIAVADCVKHIKGASAFAINRIPGLKYKIKWQEGYGVMSVGEGALGTVAAYAAHQKQHHRERTLLSIYERVDEE